MDKGIVEKRGIVKVFGISTLLFVILCGGGLFGFAAILTGFDASPQAITTVSVMICSVAAAIGGTVAAKLMSKNGLMTGFISGIISFLIVFALSLVFGDGSLSEITLVRFIAMAICASAGGVFGVNAKAKRRI